MKSRTGAALAALLIIFCLVFAALNESKRLIDINLDQLESTPFYLLIFFAATGALLMFLLVAFFFPSRLKKSELSAAPPSPPVPVSMTPVSATPIIRKMEIALEMGDYEKAEELMKDVRVESPVYWYARKMAAGLAARMGEFDKAEALYQESLEMVKGHEKAYVLFLMGDFYAERGVSERAVDLYKAALELLPTALEPVLRLRILAIRDQDWEAALSWQEYLEQRFPETLTGREEDLMKAGIRFELANSQFEKGAYKTAGSLLKNVLRMSENFTPAHLLSGEIQEKLENPTTAIRIWDRAFEATKHPITVKKIEEHYLSRSFPEKAIEYLREKTYLHPDNSVLKFCLADLYYRIEMNREAIKLFQATAEQQQGWILPLVRLAELYTRTQEHQKASLTYATLLSSLEVFSSMLWQCYTCNATYPEYRSLCMECLEWNTININQFKAERFDSRYQESAGLSV